MLLIISCGKCLRIKCLSEESDFKSEVSGILKANYFIYFYFAVFDRVIYDKIYVQLKIYKKLFQKVLKPLMIRKLYAIL